MTRNVLRGSGYARNELEKYYTPAWAVEALLRHFDVTAHGFTWEPAAGDGGMAKIMQQAGGRVVMSDIAPDSPDDAVRLNFLTAKGAPVSPLVLVNKIATNPPFGPGGSLAFQFCWHAIRLMQPVAGTVAMLMRADFDSAGGRQRLFKEHPAWHKKIVLTERLRWTNLEQKEAGPSTNHAWYIWDWCRDASRDEPVIVYEGKGR